RAGREATGGGWDDGGFGVQPRSSGTATAIPSRAGAYRPRGKEWEGESFFLFRFRHGVETACGAVLQQHEVPTARGLEGDGHLPRIRRVLNRWMKTGSTRGSVGRTGHGNLGSVTLVIRRPRA